MGLQDGHGVEYRAFDGLWYLVETKQSRLETGGSRSTRQEQACFSRATSQSGKYVGRLTATHSGSIYFLPLSRPRY